MSDNIRTNERFTMDQLREQIEGVTDQSPIFFRQLRFTVGEIERLTRELDTRTNSLRSIGESYVPLVMERDRLRAALEAVKRHITAAEGIEVDFRAGLHFSEAYNAADEALKGMPAVETSGMQTGKTARGIAEREAHDNALGTGPKDR
jgi:hypothetical protein